MSALGIVFSNLNDNNISELTEVRTMGSLPYAGRYRLIDFVLSNLVNSGITKVGVVTKNNYQSLMDHVGSGKNWDLARMNGGLVLLPPFGFKGDNGLASTRLEAIKGALGFISRSKEEYVIMSDCDMVYNLDFKDVIEYHESKMADITMVYRPVDLTYEESKKATALEVNGTGRVTGIEMNPYREGKLNQHMKLMVMKRQLLLQLASESISRGKIEFIKDVISPMINSLAVYGYEYKGYYANINSLEAYFKSNMDMLEREARNQLFNVASRPILTKVKDSPPTMYKNGGMAKNSFIADGCIIEGEVENCIIFRGARVHKGAVVKNSIIMQNNIIGSDASLNAVITDKNVVIRDKVVLSGSTSLPFYIRKGKIV